METDFFRPIFAVESSSFYPSILPSFLPLDLDPAWLSEPEEPDRIDLPAGRSADWERARRRTDELIRIWQLILYVRR